MVLTLKKCLALAHGVQGYHVCVHVTYRSVVYICCRHMIQHDSAMLLILIKLTQKSQDANCIHVSARNNSNV